MHCTIGHVYNALQNEFAQFFFKKKKGTRNNAIQIRDYVHMQILLVLIAGFFPPFFPGEEEGFVAKSIDFPPPPEKKKKKKKHKTTKNYKVNTININMIL